MIRIAIPCRVSFNTLHPAACPTLCHHEYVCIFSREDTLIWRAAWNIPKRHLFKSSQFGSCFHGEVHIIQDAFYLGANICICAVEAIFALRVWAVWDRSRRMTVFLSIVFPIVWIANFGLTGLSVGALVYDRYTRRMLGSRRVLSNPSAHASCSIWFLLRGLLADCNQSLPKRWPQTFCNETSVPCFGGRSSSLRELLQAS